MKEWNAPRVIWRVLPSTSIVVVATVATAATAAAATVAAAAATAMILNLVLWDKFLLGTPLGEELDRGRQGPGGRWTEGNPIKLCPLALVELVSPVSLGIRKRTGGHGRIVLLVVWVREKGKEEEK